MQSVRWARWGRPECGLDQFEGIERSSEDGFRVCHDGSKPVDVLSSGFDVAVDAASPEIPRGTLR